MKDQNSSRGIEPNELEGIIPECVLLKPNDMFRHLSGFTMRSSLQGS